MWKASPESPRMFESDLVDAFSRVPWYAVPAVYVPVVVGSLVSAKALGVSTPALLAQAGLGWLVWTLAEYWLHRTFFHWVPDAPWGQRFHFLVHGVHHRWFQDRLRLVMPPAVSLTLAVLLWAALRGLSAVLAPALDPSWVPGFFGGVVAGYLAYDLIHYYVHHAKPTSRVFLALRAHHSKHHHNARYKEKKFGVSTTLWDHVFRTYE